MAGRETPEPGTLEYLQAEMSRLLTVEYNRGYHKGREVEGNFRDAVARNGGTIPEYHNCHFCGEYVANGYTSDNKRHWLSDCRPDLVKHEPGEACTWRGLVDKDGNSTHPRDCYAYHDDDTRTWTDEHTHFYEDGAT